MAKKTRRPVRPPEPIGGVLPGAGPLGRPMMRPPLGGLPTPLAGGGLPTGPGLLPPTGPGLPTGTPGPLARPTEGLLPSGVPRAVALEWLRKLAQIMGITLEGGPAVPGGPTSVPPGGPPLGR
jgi:hypothetical protein